MDQQYLLMYQYEDGATDYMWFYTKEEMLEYANSNGSIHIIEGIKIIQCEQILG